MHALRENVWYMLLHTICQSPSLNQRVFLILAFSPLLLFILDFSFQSYNVVITTYNIVGTEATTVLEEIEREGEKVCAHVWCMRIHR